MSRVIRATYEFDAEEFGPCLGAGGEDVEVDAMDDEELLAFFAEAVAGGNDAPDFMRLASVELPDGRTVEPEGGCDEE